MEETNSHQCQWRGCTEDGHRHGAVKLNAFQDILDGVYLCKTHCKQAKLTRHLDVPVVHVTMGLREGLAPPVVVKNRKWWFMGPSGTPGQTTPGP